MASSGAIRMRPAVMGVVVQSCRQAAKPSSLGPYINTVALSTTASVLKRHTYKGARDTRDHSKKRGESALRRTGTRWRLSMSDEPLPIPVPREELPFVETDPDHGLWDFFQDRKTVAQAPELDSQHGRAWQVEELRHKSWDDLHRLWWVCVKERNRISTAQWERTKSELGFGDAEAKTRDREVRFSMRAIKHVLTERFYAWEDAVKLAEEDPEVDLSGKGTPYTPSEYLEDELDGEAMYEADVTAAEEERNVKKAEPASAPAMIDPSEIPASKPPGEALRI
ncbi:mitochondrial 39-S ribosomal protein L47 (MRP-L47)-domain-containing protein [Apodospora peruviana]|uniref:Large ribosomal subunit protein uL29m n=1 Tax=Apodospora peruviana TaxID=516989 RepID=A0AAE0M4F7_9PEZI|nr:mitochondrial 39-S ribosomal protein L47 (MRP-L47)-domain-containing protein [Apodospora peruviana]